MGHLRCEGAQISTSSPPRGQPIANQKTGVLSVVEATLFSGCGPCRAQVIDADRPDPLRISSPGAARGYSLCSQPAGRGDVDVALVRGIDTRPDLLNATLPVAHSAVPLADEANAPATPEEASPRTPTPLLVMPRTPVPADAIRRPRSRSDWLPRPSPRESSRSPGSWRRRPRRPRCCRSARTRRRSRRSSPSRGRRGPGARRGVPGDDAVAGAVRDRGRARAAERAADRHGLAVRCLGRLDPAERRRDESGDAAERAGKEVRRDGRAVVSSAMGRDLRCPGADA